MLFPEALGNKLSMFGNYHCYGQRPFFLHMNPLRFHLCIYIYFYNFSSLNCCCFVGFLHACLLFLVSFACFAFVFIGYSLPKKFDLSIQCNGIVLLHVYLLVLYLFLSDIDSRKKAAFLTEAFCSLEFHFVYYTNKNKLL